MLAKLLIMNLSKNILNILKTDNLQYFINSVRRCNTFVHISNDKENLEINFGHDKQHFPLVWLRDNCRCKHCFHPGSQSRIINWNNFKVDVKVQSVEMIQHDANVIINWDDNHKSIFSFEWLKKRRFTKENQEKFLKESYRPPKVLWDGTDFTNVIRKHKYKEVMTKKWKHPQRKMWQQNEILILFFSDNKFYDWLWDLACYGAVFLENAPTDKAECRRIASKIAFIRKTHYGEEFHVVAKPGTSNVAYLSSLLQLHTDLPYYEYTPGVTMLHCIEQTESKGGENLVTDVFFVAEKLRRENKEVFDILSTIKVNWLDIGEEDGVKYHSLFRAPVISLDSEGNVEKVYHSVPQRDSYFTVELEYVRPWYKALRVFVDLLNKHACQFKTQPGEIFAFDNTRLVHGRMSYEDTTQNQRYLVGFYLDWDEIYSKMRVLKQNCEKQIDM